MKIKTTHTHAACSVTQLEVNGIEFTLIRYSDANDIPLHTGKCPVIYFGVKSRYSIIANGTTYTCKKGEVLLIKDYNNMPLEVVTAGVHVFAFSFNAGWCERLAIELPLLSVRKFTKGQEAYSRVATLYRLFMEDTDFSIITVQRLLLQLLEDLINAEHNANANEPPWAKRIRPVLATLPLNKLSLEHLTKLGKVSEVTISGGFKKQFGVLFKDYKINRQMETALELFAAGEHTHLEISDLCCYKDYAYFSNVFKKKMGQTPYQYWLEKKEL